MTDRSRDEDAADEATTLSPRRDARREVIDAVPGMAGTDLDDATTLSPRRRGAPDDDPEDRTALSRRHERPVEDTDVPQIDDDRTSVAARRIEPPLEVSDIPRGSLEAAEATESPLDHTIVQRREVDTSITRGRADTPRTAAVPGATGSKAIYRPRADAPAPTITRTPVTPPTAVDPVGAANVRPRRRRGFLLALVAGVVVIVGGAITGIMLIIGGG